MSSIPVRITRIKEGLPLPTYATEGSVGFDIVCPEDTVVPAHGIALVLTGLIVATPPGYMLLLAPRSSLFRKMGLRLANTIGIVDQDFCGPEDELGVSFWNTTEHDVCLHAGDRIAQGVLVSVARATWQETPVTTDASRGGWGHSGGYTSS